MLLGNYILQSFLEFFGSLRWTLYPDAISSVTNIHLHGGAAPEPAVNTERGFQFDLL